MGLSNEATPDFKDKPFAVPNNDWWAPPVPSRLWADIMPRSDRRALRSECYDRICNQNFPFSSPTPHQSSPKPCMAQTLGRDVVLFSGSSTACRPTFGDQRHLVPTWRPIKDHSSVMKPLMVLICSACALKLYQ